MCFDWFYWFYSLPPHSLYNFEKITNIFLTQYAARREAKKNNHHILTVKMRQDDSFKSYIGYFQNQLVKVPNCDEDVSALAFINRLQISYPLYKYTLKHDITRMSEVLSQARPYIQLDEVMKSSTTSLSTTIMTERSWSRSTKFQPVSVTRIGGQPAYKSQALSVLSPNPLQAFKMEQHLTPLRLPINEVFNSIKDQHWLSAQSESDTTLFSPEWKNIVFFNDSKRHKTIHCRTLQKYMEELIPKGFLLEYVLTPRAASDAGQSSNLPPTQLQHMIAQ